jgi:hypothetical protein
VAIPSVSDLLHTLWFTQSRKEPQSGQNENMLFYNRQAEATDHFTVLILHSLTFFTAFTYELEQKQSEHTKWCSTCPVSTAMPSPRLLSETYPTETPGRTVT